MGFAFYVITIGYLWTTRYTGGLPETSCDQPSGHPGSQADVPFPVCDQVCYLLQHRSQEVDLLQGRQQGPQEGEERLITPLSMRTKSVWLPQFFSMCVSIFHQVFPGNQEAYETKKNIFFPPVVGRFIRLHPINWYNKATIRMEFYGCELDGKMVLFVWVYASHTTSQWKFGLHVHPFITEASSLLISWSGFVFDSDWCSFICDIWTTIESSKTFCSLLWINVL